LALHGMAGSIKHPTGIRWQSVRAHLGAPTAARRKSSSAARGATVGARGKMLVTAKHSVCHALTQHNACAVATTAALRPCGGASVWHGGRAWVQVCEEDHGTAETQHGCKRTRCCEGEPIRPSRSVSPSLRLSPSLPMRLSPSLSISLRLFPQTPVPLAPDGPPLLHLLTTSFLLPLLSLPLIVLLPCPLGHSSCRSCRFRGACACLHVCAV
jgi:hypothetical protein